MVAPDSTANMPPNIGLEPTPSSLRSSVAPASRRGSGLALDSPNQGVLNTAEDMVEGMG
jgi:hypothetical protein